MQVTSIVVFFLAAVSGTLAAPGRGDRVTQNRPQNNGNSQTNQCGNGASPFCCSPEVDKNGKAYTKCVIKDSCNAITMCCNNQNNQNNQGSNNGGNANQQCSINGGQVVFAAQ